MSNYSDNPRMCRVDFFRPSGKWYATEAVLFLNGMYDSSHDIHDVFAAALKDHFGGNVRFDGMLAICLEPYHQHSHPIAMMICEKGIEVKIVIERN